jgi:hypothetical protein
MAAFSRMKDGLMDEWKGQKGLKEHKYDRSKQEE